MKPPSPREFIVEQIRVLVPPEQAHYTAPALISGVFPLYADTALNAALNWFGTNLYPAPAPNDDIVSSRMRDVGTARHHALELESTNDTAVLDLVHVTHATAVRDLRDRLSTAVCGFATLSLAGTQARASIGLRFVGASARQLRVSYQALPSKTPQATLRAVKRAVHPSATPIQRQEQVTAMPLSHLIDGRTGVPGTELSTVDRVHDVTYADDNNAVWSLMPLPAGNDLNYDTLIASRGDSAYYRVFDADPAFLPKVQQEQSPSLG